MKRENAKHELSRLLCLILLAVGLLCSAVLLARRVSAELRSREVSCAVSYADVRALAGTGSASEADWLRCFRDAGVAYLIAGDSDADDAAAAAQAAGMALGRCGERAQPLDAFLIPRIENEALLSKTLEPDDAVPLAVTEDLARTGVLLPEGLEPDALTCPTVKTLYLMERYRLWDDGGEAYFACGNVLFRAAAERGMRLLVLRPLLTEDGTVVTDPAVYTKLLSEVRGRLAGSALTLGDTFSALDAPKTNRLLLAGALLAAAALAAGLLSALLPLTERWRLAVLALVSAAGIACALWKSDLAVILGSFGAATAGGCLAALALRKAWQDAPAGRGGVSCFFCLSLRLLLTGLCVGLYVAALMSTRRYMLGFSVFRGVKAAELLPLLLCAALLILEARRSGVRLRGTRRGPVIAACVLLAALIVAWALLRSGDAVRFMGSLEERARDWMERVFPIRPRTKELIAYPCAALFVLLRRRGAAVTPVIFGVVSVLAAVSAINSFCHAVTPLHLTLYRTALGAVLGAVLGCVVLGLGNALHFSQKAK